jgi:hypothetical protein
MHDRKVDATAGSCNAIGSIANVLTGLYEQTLFFRNSAVICLAFLTSTVFVMVFFGIESSRPVSPDTTG